MKKIDDLKRKVEKAKNSPKDLVVSESLYTRIQQDKIPYDIWQKRGLLRLCQGNSINYRDVTVWFLEMINDFGITPLWVYYDSYSARYWTEEIEGYKKDIKLFCKISQDITLENFYTCGKTPELESPNTNCRL